MGIWNPTKYLQDAFPFGSLRMEIKLRLNATPEPGCDANSPGTRRLQKQPSPHIRAWREMSSSLLGTTALDNYVPLNKIPFTHAAGRGVSPPLNCCVLLLCFTEQLLMFRPRGVCSSVMGEMIKASKALDHLEWKVLHKRTPLVLLMLNKANFTCSWFYSSSSLNTCSLLVTWLVNATHVWFAWWILQLSLKKPASQTDDMTHAMLGDCHERSAVFVEVWRSVNLGPLLRKRKGMTLGIAGTSPGVRMVENLAWDQSTNKNRERAWRNASWWSCRENRSF